MIIDSADGDREWSTMGSDTNIIAASAAALADSLEYAIWKAGAELRRRDERHFTTTSVTPRDVHAATAADAHDPANPTRRLPMTTPTAADAAAQAPTLHLARWTVTSGSNANSRGAVVIASGDHQWEASAEGNGAVDALFRAVDTALADVLTGHPRLLAYDVHALGEGPDAEGRVTVAVAPPDGASRAARRRPLRRARRPRRTSSRPRSRRTSRRSTCSWPRSTGRARRRRPATGKRAKVSEPDAKARRAELDEDAGKIDTTEWFNQ